MAKAKMVRTLEPIDGDAVGLRRWCVEMAVRWPVHNESGYSNANYGGGHSAPSVHKDEDVIGRAEKILTWVTMAR